LKGIGRERGEKAFQQGGREDMGLKSRGMEGREECRPDE
jgi:hypothetical protein